MKRLFTKLALVSFVALVLAVMSVTRANALAVAPTPDTLPDSPLIITGYQVVSGHLVYVQLYNDSDKPINLEHWSLEYETSLAESNRIITGFSDWIEPSKHLVVGSQTAFEDRIPFSFVDIIVPDGVFGVSLTLRHYQDLYEPAIQTIKKDSSTSMHRTKTSTGNYSSSTSFAPLIGDILSDIPYAVPKAPDISIVEVLPNARDCSPFDASDICSDYVKLKLGANFDLNDIDLYRLRVGHKGTRPSITNAFSLVHGVVSPDYLRISMRDDGDIVSLTDSGAYIWIEDKYGITAYNSTFVSYPSASSQSKIGWAWAHDDVADTWTWTASPQPNAANVIYVPKEIEIIATPTELATCGPGKYRNPETNRCKSITTSAVLSPCGAGQVRSPETNRCRSITSSTSSLTPCDPGQERNPETNRCRSVLASATSLVPCKTGYERNPETNRCRKAGSEAQALSSAVAQTDTADGAGNFPYGSVVLGSMGVAAVSYGVYEWRRELMSGVRRVIVVFGKK